MSNLISALLFYGLILPLSWMPFRILYIISDGIFVLLYYVFPYRKKIVRKNLRSSFPEKSDDELNIIERKFYKHFCDLILESIKIFSASPKSILDRVEMANTELLNDYYGKGKSLILVTGHYGNWEWPAITLPYHSKHTGTGIYKKLSNKFFDKKLRDTRARFGMLLMSTKEVADFFESHKDKLCLYGFINDQSPGDPKRGHWAMFLNQPTCLLKGAETYAVKYQYPVVYGIIRRKSRGRYAIEYRLVSDNPASTAENFITEECSRINESLIKSDPAYWLWTHKRWKHKPPADFIPQGAMSKTQTSS